MRIMNKTELKEKIAKAMERAKVTQNITANSNSRQIEKTNVAATERAETLFGILEALNGNPVYLNIMAGE